MITKTTEGNQLFVWIWIKGKAELLYKRWLGKDYGIIMDRQPFTSKDTESFKK